MKRILNWPLLVALALLTACAQLGVPTAKNFGERLAVGYIAVAGVRDGATTLLQARKITADDAQNIQKQADTARAGLDIARNLRATNPGAAEDRLSMTITALTALQTYLQARNK